jgi:hypothetical protein
MDMIDAIGNTSMVRLRKLVPWLLAALLSGCTPTPDKLPRTPAVTIPVASSSSARTTTPDSLSLVKPAFSTDRSPVRAGEITAAVRTACDSASLILHETLALTARREEGDFLDTPREIPRTGCRLSATGPFKALPNEVEPIDALGESFARHGWRQDLRYGGDGPDGETVGMRLHDVLCLLAGRWEGGDDEDTSSTKTPNDSYDAIIECARDIASNKDAGVPDSIWSIASRAGFDSIYAISQSMQYPPYLEGDFDGDRVEDAAVLVEHRSTGKLGLAIVRLGPKQVTVLGAGSSAAGPDDLGWINRWDVFRKGSTIHLTIHYRPNAQLIADALWVGRDDSVGAFYIWTGRGFTYEEHKR